MARKNISHALDEGSVVGVERVTVEPLLDPVRQASRVESVLQVPVPCVIETAHSWMMLFMAPRVHVSEQVPAEVDAGARRDFELVPSPQGAEGIVAMLTVTIDDAYLEAAGAQLRVVANYAVGVNNIDLEAARRRGIVIANTPDVLTRATAEIALTLMLSLLRRVTEGDRFVRRRAPWQFSLEFMLGERLEGKTVLIVGAGRIGRETARLAEAFGAHIVLAGSDDDLDTLLPDADVVSLHTPLTPRDAAPHRRAASAADEADGRPDQHRARPGRRRGGARRGPPRRRRSPGQGSTSTSASRT